MQTRQCATFPTKVHIAKAMVFLVVLYGCENWTTRRQSTKELMLSNCCAGEDSWESLGQQGDQTSNLKGNQHWILIERTDAEAEVPILWPPDVKRWLIGKDPVTGKDWRQEEKRVTEDEMVGWHHWFKWDMNLGKLWEMVRDREAWHAAVPGVMKSRTWLGDWTTSCL